MSMYYSNQVLKNHLHKIGGDITSCQEEILRGPSNMKKMSRMSSVWLSVWCVRVRNIRGIAFKMRHDIDQLNATRKTKKFGIELIIGERIEEIMWKRRY